MSASTVRARPSALGRLRRELLRRMRLEVTVTCLEMTEPQASMPKPYCSSEHIPRGGGTLKSPALYLAYTKQTNRSKLVFARLSRATRSDLQQ